MTQAERYRTDPVYRAKIRAQQHIYREQHRAVINDRQREAARIQSEARREMAQEARKRGMA